MSEETVQQQIDRIFKKCSEEIATDDLSVSQDEEKVQFPDPDDNDFTEMYLSKHRLDLEVFFLDEMRKLVSIFDANGNVIGQKWLPKKWALTAEEFNKQIIRELLIAKFGRTRDDVNRLDMNALIPGETAFEDNRYQSNKGDVLIDVKISKREFNKKNRQEKGKSSDLVSANVIKSNLERDIYYFLFKYDVLASENIEGQPKIKVSIDRCVIKHIREMDFRQVNINNGGFQYYTTREFASNTGPIDTLFTKDTLLNDIFIREKEKMVLRNLKDLIKKSINIDIERGLLTGAKNFGTLIDYIASYPTIELDAGIVSIDDIDEQVINDIINDLEDKMIEFTNEDLFVLTIQFNLVLSEVMPVGIDENTYVGILATELAVEILTETIRSNGGNVDGGNDLLDKVVNAVERLVSLAQNP